MDRKGPVRLKVVDRHWDALTILYEEGFGPVEAPFIRLSGDEVAQGRAFRLALHYLADVRSPHLRERWIPGWKMNVGELIIVVLACRNG